MPYAIVNSAFLFIIKILILLAVQVPGREWRMAEHQKVLILQNPGIVLKHTIRLKQMFDLCGLDIDNFSLYK